MPWSLACDQYGRCITLPESFPLKTFHLYNRSSGKVPVPSPPACSLGTRQPHPSPALGSCWALAGSGAVCHWVGQSLLHGEMCETGSAQRRPPHAGVAGWRPMGRGAWSPWGCLAPAPVWLDPLPAPVSTAPGSAHHCIPDQGTARPRHLTGRAPPLPLVPRPQSFAPLQPPLPTGLFTPSSILVP